MLRDKDIAIEAAIAILLPAGRQDRRLRPGLALALTLDGQQGELVERVEYYRESYRTAVRTAVATRTVVATSTRRPDQFEGRIQSARKTGWQPPDSRGKVRGRGRRCL